jgi:hypothetical protein
LALALAASVSLNPAAWPHGSGGDSTDPSDVDLGCSVHSLRGAYVIQGFGTFVPPGTPLPYPLGVGIPVHFQNLSLFDGQGNMTTPVSVDTSGGRIERNFPAMGTYTVQPDCTGELVVQTDHAPEFGGSHVHHIFLTVVGPKFYLTFTDPGATGSAIGERIRKFWE